MSEVLNEKLEGGTQIKEALPELKKPRMFKVVLNNDDYTPMDFVVGILKGFFSKTEQQATRIMLQVHYQGKAVCGTYTRDIAETKVEQVNAFSRQNDFPLLCSMEVE